MSRERANSPITHSTSIGGGTRLVASKVALMIWGGRSSLGPHAPPPLSRLTAGGIRVGGLGLDQILLHWVCVCARHCPAGSHVVADELAKVRAAVVPCCTGSAFASLFLRSLRNTPKPFCGRRLFFGPFEQR